MNVQRKVIGSQTKFFRSGQAFTQPAAGTADKNNKPDITDPKWLDMGAIKWSKSPTSKTEEYMEASPGAYVVTDEIALSVGLKYKGKLEKQSNIAYELALAAKPSASLIPDSPTAGGQYNPLASSPIIQGWLHIQEYGQDNVLINTVDVFVALKASGDTNNDDKAAETPIEATVLRSTLNSGTLS